MRRQIIIRSTFAKALDQKFQKGQKVYYSTHGGAEYPGIIVGVGQQRGDTVYDVQLDYDGAKKTISWGYEDQFRGRNTGDGTKDDRPEDEAYKAGANSRRTDQNPYNDTELKAAWERGRKVRKQTEKADQSTRYGDPRMRMPKHAMVKEQQKYYGFGAHTGGDAVAKDFNSERGWIAKVFSSNGRVVAQSEPFLSDSPAEEWLQKQIDKAARLGYHVTGKVFNGFFDPATLAKA